MPQTVDVQKAIDLRHELGLSQMDVARKLHMSPSAVCDYEVGHRRMPSAYMIALQDLGRRMQPDSPTPDDLLHAMRGRCAICAALERVA